MRILINFIIVLVQTILCIFRGGLTGHLARIYLLTSFFIIFNFAYYIHPAGLEKYSFAFIKEIFLNKDDYSPYWLVLIVYFIIAFLVRYLVKEFKPQRKTLDKPLTKKQLKQLKEHPYAITIDPLYLLNPFRGILISGSAGSGKSVSIVRPIMRSAAQKFYCGILYDFKYPTLTEELAGYMEHYYNPLPLYTIDFYNMKRTHRVNPLHPDYIKTSAQAEEYAYSIVQNLIPESIEKPDFWIRSSTSYLKAIIYFLARHLPNLSSFPHVVAFCLQDIEKTLPVLAADRQTKGMVQSLIEAHQRKADNQLTGVISTLQVAISKLNSPEIFYVLSGNDFSLDINKPGESKWLVLANHPTETETTAPLFSLITTVATKLMNQPDKLHSMIILDEAPTLFIPNLEHLPATARSNKISLVYCAQDDSQIVKSYGETKTQVIISNLNNQFYGKASNYKTAERVSKMFGKEDRTFTTYSETDSAQGGSSGTSESIQQREKLPPDAIITLKQGQFVGVAVESNKDFFKNYFPYQEPILKKQEDLRQTQPDIEKNFNQIYDEIEGLFQE